MSESDRARLAWYALIASTLNVAIAEIVAPDGSYQLGDALEAFVWTAVPITIAAFVAAPVMAAIRHRGVVFGVGAGVVSLGLWQPFVNGTSANLAAVFASAVVALAAWMWGRDGRLGGTPASSVLVVATFLLWEVARMALAPALADSVPFRPGETLIAAAAAALLALVASRAVGRRALAPALAGAAILAGAAGAVAWMQEDRLPPRPAPRPGSTSVLLVTVDTLRADRLDARLPDGSPLMPNMRDFAARASNYTRAYSLAPWTKPSVASILTGLDVLTHGVVDVDSAIPPQVMTVAERLRNEGGYRTAAVVSNPLLRAEYGYGRGFDRWEHFPYLPRAGRSIGEEIRARIRPRRDASDAEITDRVLNAMTDAAGQPFFMWAHYFNPHAPYQPPPWASDAVGAGVVDAPPPVPDDVRRGEVVTPAQRILLQKLYDAEVLAVDAEIGRLFSTLRDRGQFDDALIIVASDHGEEFWEHGGFEHGHTMHEELLRVPLLVKVPGQLNPGSIDDLVSTRSIADLVLGADGLDATELVVARSILHGPQLVAAVSGGWKLVAAPDLVAAGSMYDLLQDPGESFPIPSVGNPVAATLLEQLAAADAAAEAQRAAMGVRPISADMDRALARELRDLRYVR